MIPQNQDASPPTLIGTKAPWRGMASVGLATIATAAAGWLVLVIVARTRGPHEYAQFAVLWGLAYALAGTLSGVQQETSRAVSTAIQDASHLEPTGRWQRPLPVVGGLLIGIVASTAVIATSFAWGPSVLGHDWFDIAVALGAGLLAVTGFLVLRGVLAALSRWGTFAALGGADSAIRLAVVAGVCVWGGSLVGLTWGIVSGWLVWIPLLALPTVRATLRARGDRDSLSGTLVASVHAMIATGCSALLVAGFPFLVSLTADEPLDASVGVLFAAVLITRTPLMLPLNGYQLAILTYFVRKRDDLRKRLFQILIRTSVAGCVASGLAYVAGPPVMEALLGSEFDASGRLLAVLVAAAVALVLLTLTGIALLALGRLHAYTTGWVAATVATVVTLLLPLPVVDRCVYALCVGPLVGLAVHAWFITRERGAGQPRPASA